MTLSSIIETIRQFIEKKHCNGTNYYEVVLEYFKKSTLSDEEVCEIEERISNAFVTKAIIISQICTEARVMIILKRNKLNKELCLDALTTYQTKNFYRSLLKELQKKSFLTFNAIIKNSSIPFGEILPPEELLGFDIPIKQDASEILEVLLA